MENKNSEKQQKIQAVDNPLAFSQPKTKVISPSEEIEQKVQAVTEIESLAEINKQQLSVRRQRVELEVENKKLDTAKKTIDSIEKIIHAVSDEEVLSRVTKKINTPADMRMMAEAAERLTNTLKNLMNPTLQDEFGNRKRTKIMAAFQAPSGEKMMISAEVPNNAD